MTELLTLSDIEAGARAMIRARVFPLGIEVTTPVVYPNGDCIAVVVAPEMDGGYVVHDAGLGAMYVTGEGVQLSRDLRARIAATIARYDCQFESARIVRRCKSDEVPTSIMLVANASRSAGDMAAETRRQSENHFRAVLTNRIREIVGPRLRENEAFKTMSGITYRVPNTILDAEARQPVAFVLPLVSRSAVANQFRELFELKVAFPMIVRESVYDEESDFRPVEDGWALAQIGEVTPFHDLQRALPALLANVPPQPSLPN